MSLFFTFVPHFNSLVATFEPRQLREQVQIMVTNPDIFRVCLEWKSAEINDKWDKHLNMLAAVD